MAQSFKLNTSEAIQPASVINLSSYVLKECEVKLLSKGLKFIPKTSKSDENAVNEALEKFIRRIKLTEFFSNNPLCDPDRTPKQFLPKSDWVPPDCFIRKDILEQLKALKDNIISMNLRQDKAINNITPEERRALKSLKNNNDIIIKPADKGSSTVIMNKEDYIKEGLNQLSNEKHYKKLNHPIYPDVSDKINNLLSKIKDKKIIDKKQYDYLKVPDNPRDRKFYLLPKIHKEKDKWKNGKIPPGRPIVSDCGSDTYHLSEFIDSYLQPLATKHASFLRDTPDFLDKLSNLTCSPNSLLITLDVDSLYTNIDNKDGLETINNIFNQNPNEKRPSKEILDLLKICLENNDFIFNNDWYLQVGGTAMGKKFAPNYANLFLSEWEEKALEKCPKKPECYFRYLDDIFIIWSIHLMISIVSSIF